MSHPWSDFLAARARAIDWLYSGEGNPIAECNDAFIAQTLSMDRMQVFLIRTRDRSLDIPRTPDGGAAPLHKPPYPEFCIHPERCIHGRCERDPVCND